MAAITSAQTGNWSATSTWTGGVVPGNGDTATIAHTVTVDQNTTIGTSPDDATTYVLTLTTASVGTIAVADNVTLTIRGNIYSNSGSSGNIRNSFTLGAGSKIIIDSSQCATPTRAYVFHVGRWSKIYSRGTSSNRAAIESIAGSYGKFKFTTINYEQGNCFDAEYTDFNRLGANGVVGMGSYPSNNYVKESRFVNCLWDTCGRIEIKIENSGGSFYLTGNRVINPTDIQSYGFRFKGIVGNTATSTVSNNSFDQPVMFNPGAKTSVTGNYFGAFMQTSSSADGSEYSFTEFSNNLIAQTFLQANTFEGNDSNSYWLIDNTNPNPALIGWQAICDSRTITGSIFDYTGTGFVGDLIFPQSSPGHTMTFSRNILLPNGIGIAPGKFVSFYTGAANTGAPIENVSMVINGNTFVTHQDGTAPETGMGVGEINIAGGQTDASIGHHAGEVASFKNNLVYTPPGKTPGYKFVREHSHIQDFVAAANADYNWGWNLATGNEGNGYHSWESERTNDFFSTGTPDVNGTTGDPGFVDITRNFPTFHSAKLGNVATAWANASTYAVGDIVSTNVSGYYNNATINYRCKVAHTSNSGSTTLGQPGSATSWRTSWEFASHDYIRTSPLTRITELIAWIKAGFTPTNAATKTAGEAGTYVGAIEYIPPSGSAAAALMGY